MPNALLLISLASLPLFCWAQKAPPEESAYIGVKLSVQTELLPFYDYHDSQFGPALTLGAQLKPGLTLELSTAYNWQHYTYHDSYTTTTGLVVEDGNTHAHIFTIPVLVRAALTKSASRWHVDALAGPTLQFYVANHNYLQTTQGKVTRSENGTSVEHQFTLNLGPSVRYTLTPRVDLVVDALANLTVTGLPYTLVLHPRLSSHVLAGLHYHLKH